MRPLSRIRLIQKVVPLIGDVAIFSAAMLLSMSWRSEVKEPNVLSFLPIFATWIGVLYTAGLYELRIVRDFVQLVGGLVLSAVVCWTVGITYIYLLPNYLPIDFTPKTILISTVIIGHIGILAWRRAVLTIFRFNLLDLRIVMLADDVHHRYLSGSSEWCLQKLNVADHVSRDVDLLVVDSEWQPKDSRLVRASLAQAISLGVPIASLDEFYESVFGKVSSSHANDLGWLINHVLSRHGSLYFRAKRVVDVLIASVLLLATAPVMAVTALLILVVDRIPPFYAQERVGYLGGRFTLRKFQTMKPGADAQGPFAKEAGAGDPRATTLGRWLRRFRLDELPQLWNVLRGDMSLVGPRPEWIREVEILELSVANYHVRHLVPPGLTGWAQVYFRATNDAADSIEKQHYDLYYLKHFSLALDLSILLKTLSRVLIRDSRVSTHRDPFPSRPFHDEVLDSDVALIVARSRSEVDAAMSGGATISKIL